VHTAVYRALGPRFNPSLIAGTFACLDGRGSHRAILFYLRHLRAHPYAVHLDIRTYYPSVDHGILRELLAPRIRDPRVVALLDRLLASNWRLYRQGDVRSFFGLGPLSRCVRPHGLPIGNLTSQWWGNLYLDGLDHFIKRKLKVTGYLRYMDDLVCFGESRAYLKRCKAEIQAWVQDHRRLRLNERKAHILPAGVVRNWLGYRVTRAGVDLGPKAVKRFRANLPRIMSAGLPKLKRALAAWRGMMTF